MEIIILITCIIALILLAIKKDKLFVNKYIPKCTCNSFYYHDERTDKVTGGPSNCEIHNKNE